MNHQLDSLTQQIKTLSEKLDKLEKEKKISNQRKCWTCGSPDHMRRNCPHRRWERPKRYRRDILNSSGNKILMNSIETNLAVSVSDVSGYRFCSNNC